MIWVRRGVVLAIALIATAIAFQFWGKFAGAMHNAMTQEAAPAPPANTGEVTVGIIPATLAQTKPSCDKTHPCPR